MKAHILTFSLILILLSSCIEEPVKEETTTVTLETTIFTTTIETTSTITEVVTTTTEPEKTTTTTLKKLAFSCADYCKKENYVDGICRKTPSECRRYNINEIYKPLGDKYCPRGTGYNTCCCIFIKETTAATVAVTTTTIEKKNSATLFGKIQPIDATIKYKTDGLLTFKLLNVAGVDVKIINISSENCSGLGLGSLSGIKIKNGADVAVTANCDKKGKNENFDIDVKIVYNEFVSEVAAIQSEESGKISGFAEE